MCKCDIHAVFQLHGGIGIIHANFATLDDQVKEVTKVKVKHAHFSCSSCFLCFEFGNFSVIHE